MTKPRPTISQRFAAEAAGEIAETVRQRGQVYAAPEINFGQIAEAWRMWIRWRHGVDVALSAADAGIMQALIKLSRHAASPAHADTALDLATYALLATGCAQDAAVAAQGD